MSARRTLGLMALASLGCPDASSPRGYSPLPPPAVTALAAPPRVIADERGFTPGSLDLARGGPGEIVFRRTSEDTCATAVVFPEAGIEQELPLGEDVIVRVPTTEPRTLVFQCGMGMYRSRVVVR